MPGGAENPVGRDAAPVGACVNLSGEKINASIRTVPCGSSDNNYIVIQRVNFPTDCVADADRRYYHNSKQGEFTACLDLAWSPASCISIDSPKVVRTACDDAQAPNRYRPIKVVLNTENVDSCPDKGFPHAVRKFTVCTETQK
ncbi:LppU/SCO3897 family protein [Mycobacteroides franklinii]